MRNVADEIVFHTGYFFFAGYIVKDRYDAANFLFFVTDAGNDAIKSFFRCRIVAVFSNATAVSCKLYFSPCCQNPALSALLQKVRKFDFVAIAGQASLGITAICALLVLKIFSGAAKKAAAMTTARQLAGGEGAAGLLPGETMENEPVAMRKQIAGSLQSNPEQVRQLFASWLEQKGE